MRPFDFHAADTDDAVFDVMAHAPGARLLAGGTSLVDLMKLDVERPEHVIDVTSLPHGEVIEEGGSLWIGATVRNSDLAYHPLTTARVPVLAQALLAGASPQLRNLATTGGNLLQRTRCSYFRDTAWACNKRDPGAGCSALDGVNRGHAILGASDACIATSPSDMNVALTALDARIHVKSSSSRRIIPIDAFFRPPGATPHIETSLRDDELITSVEIPLRPWFARSRYVKVRDRASYAFALASAAVALDLDGDTIREARVALGGVGTVPWRACEAEDALKCRQPSPTVFQTAADAALADARPRRHNAFKVDLAKATLVRALGEMTA